MLSIRRTAIRITRQCGGSGGYTLFELIVTLAVLGVLVMGSIPIAQNAARRQKELRLRETLRQIRSAIDEFKRDTVGACPQGSVSTGNPTRQGGANAQADPRSRVVIDDCTIFETDNLDRYPPDLETLVDGVRVKARGLNMQGGGGLTPGSRQATEINDATDEVVKHYLTKLPIDPMTGESDWRLRSSYQEPDDDSWDDINVFDVRSASDEEGLNGEKYSDW
jgi:general secretion pathway protein G